VNNTDKRQIPDVRWRYAEDRLNLSDIKDDEYSHTFWCPECTAQAQTVYIEKGCRRKEVRGVICNKCGCDMTERWGR